jgi:hypothetical protein
VLDGAQIQAPAPSGEPPAIATNTRTKRLRAERTTEQDDNPEATGR